MTTDPEPLARSARRRRPGASVRTRITAALAALALVAFAPAGLIVYLIERARIDNAVAALADQELAEFEKFQADARDPTTGRPFTDVAGLITRFLTRNVPGDDELLVGWWNDDAQIGSANDPLANAPAFDEAVRRHLDAGGTERITSNGVQYQVTVQPVRNRETRGALVVSVNLDQAHAELNSTMRTYAIVAALSLGLITALAFWQAGRLLAPVRTLRDTTREITGTDLSRRIPVTGNDDLTDLSVTFNDMLDRLDAAFTTQREFLDDAGHELKTPLTVVRGHLELLDVSQEDEVTETRALLLDEVDRMSRLVNDLVLLAKSQRPDFLNSVPADLGRVTESVLAKARALGDRDWRLDGSAQRLVHLDEQRVTQAMLALAENAVKHTGEGDVVAVGSAYDGGAARMWVRDAGAGVADEDRGVIFQRFGRSMVRPGDEGFGLGLSIVRAIARAHGGDVHVEDAEPCGSRFVITIPGVATPANGPEDGTWPGS